MIHHLSIAVNYPLRVASVLAEIWKGKVFDFFPIPGSYIVIPFDEYGSAIEVYPIGTELIPDWATESPNSKQKTEFSKFVATHAAISVPMNQERIERIGAREGWRVELCNPGPFKVIKFWVENWLMLEFLTPEIIAGYLAFASQPQAVEHVFGSPVQSAQTGVEGGE
ncbi:hypothetical protein K9N68_11190 [Kovacikia minuta CCNUW1]|uniref:hypothetical protein n=1 Tax=Kovacikia minuta TaxID=2931930 RepID=UPI001CCCC3C3|nr:hypothetical protein [Kovacikia minuta]UBF28384.1 hypothetical protein K9N68_11190 [Kovacikia minuta CCNUW1]